MQYYRHYALTTVLGDGKTGQTWQALDSGHERPVALRFVSGGLSVPARLRLTDASDVSIDRQLRLAPVFGIDDNPEGVVIIRGYIDGQSVKAISQRRMLTFDEFLNLAAGIARAVGGLHDAGIVHGNLTSDNVFVTESEEVWLTDAGAWPDDARTNLRLSLDRDLSYAAPEQLDGRPATVESDLYMLGVVFYELLTGRLPFTLDDREFLIAAVGHELPNFENDATLRMPGEGRLIIQRLLEKRPEDRIASAGELLTTVEAMRSFRSKESTAGSRERARWTAKQYAIVAVVMALLLLYWLVYSQVVR